MLDLRYVRENKDKVEAAIGRRNGGFSIKELLVLDEEYREVLARWEDLNRRRNEISESFKSGKFSPEEKKAMAEESKKLKQEHEDVSTKRVELDEKIKELQMAIPNTPDDSVPNGADETENVEVSKWGEVPDIKDPKAHWELGANLNLLDFERGVKIAQSRFTVLFNQGAKLERALMNFMLDFHSKNGYTEVFPPILINRECMEGTGQLPKFEGDFYKCADDELYLAPTAEVPVTNLYRKETLKEEDMPIMHCCYTPNFRREAGSAGKDTRGYIRQHQFNKVELVKFTTPESSEEEHEKLTRDAERILEELKLPYRKVLLCAGDLGFCARKCYDLEVWFPYQNKYREISSCSNFAEFQARRAGIKYKPKEGGKAKFIHTINGSGLAIGRTLAAIIENNQMEDGSVKVPEVLTPYLNGLTVIKPN